jgi:RND family efflux transporter MFP subunit
MVLAYFCRTKKLFFNRKIMRKFILVSFVLVVAALVSWKLILFASSKEKSTKRGKTSIAVICENITKGNIEDTAEFTGALAGNMEVSVSPKLPGLVNKIYVDLGDEVEEGQLLATLDDEEIKNEVDEAKAKLLVARAALEEINTSVATAQSELERIKTLRKRKVAAETELETSESEVAKFLGRKRVAEANITQQEAALRAAETRLSYTRINSPIKGFVGKRYVDEGAMMSASTPIVSLANMTLVKTVISVVESDYAKVLIGLKASLKVDAYPDQVFEGQVTRIAPILDPDTRTAETEIEFDNANLLLKPGMFARVLIRYGVRHDVILVPTHAIVKREMQMGVFVPGADNKTTMFIAITKGISNPQLTEINSEQSFEQVIVMGQHLLSDGDSIVISKSKEK